jgi:glycosyltransferase involved in cell wall biosynthesis
MNVAFLMASVPGYFAACISSLAARDGTDVLMICEAPVPEAPYDPEEVTPVGAEVHSFDSLPDGRTIAGLLQEFKPDVVLVSGWQRPAFRYALQKLPPSGTVRVLMMDNQWLGTAKQWVGVAISPWYLHRFFDIAFLPGDRQEVFANKLGFKNSQIWRGVYSCDYPRLASAPQPARRDVFLFVGRFVKEKGVQHLAEAYRAYRKTSENPWGLEVYGIGPEGYRFDGIDGIEKNEFAQPSDLPQIYRRSGCLVLPSLFEPWGAVIHEATSSGLPVICSTACGAAPYLVEDGVNGYLVEPGNAVELTETLHRYSHMEPSLRQQMGDMSSQLAARYTPERWASLFQDRAERAVARLSEKRLRD